MTEPVPPAPAQQEPSFWQRRLVDPIVRQLTQGISVEKIALTLAVGSALALFPILGTTTLLCLIVGVSLRLNQPLIQLVNGLCTLPHLIVIYALLRFGNFLFGYSPLHLTVQDFLFRAPRAHPSLWSLAQTVWHDHGATLHRAEILAVHAIVAWAVIAPLWILAVYWIAKPALHRLNVLRGGKFLPEGEEAREG